MAFTYYVDIAQPVKHNLIAALASAAEDVTEKLHLQKLISDKVRDWHANTMMILVRHYSMNMSRKTRGILWMFYLSIHQSSFLLEPF